MFRSQHSSARGIYDGIDEVRVEASVTIQALSASVDHRVGLAVPILLTRLAQLIENIVHDRQQHAKLVAHAFGPPALRSWLDHRCRQDVGGPVCPCQDQHAAVGLGSHVCHEQLTRQGRQHPAPCI